MDVSGEQQLDIAPDIYKQRFDLSGNPISETKKESSLPSLFEFGIDPLQHFENCLSPFNLECFIQNILKILYTVQCTRLSILLVVYRIFRKILMERLIFVSVSISEH